MIVLYVLLGWIALSIPVALVVGMAIRKGQSAIPVARLEIPIDDPAAAPVPTHR